MNKFPWPRTVLGIATAALILVSAGAFFNTLSAKKQTLTDREIKTRDYMIEISRQLGVTCNYCHDVGNFRDSSMKTWKKSKDHIRVVELLNTRAFTGPNAPKADCFMCHRGKAIPDYKEKIR